MAAKIKKFNASKTFIFASYLNCLLNPQMAKSAKFCLLVYGALSVLSSHALAIDLQPNDIVAPTPDRTAISISYVNAQNTTLYVNNVPTGASPNLESNLGIVRLGHTYTIGSLPAVSYVQVGGGTLSPDGSLSAYPASQGMTDTTIATAIWPYANHTTRTYFGVAAYLSLPTGEYSTTKAFNLGSNRYSQALQLGYQRPITKSVDGAFAFDTVWYGANSQCAAACSSATNLQFTQKPLYSSQIGPIYRINQTYTVAATYVYVTGGETAFNGIERNNTVVTQRYFVSGVAYTKIGRFMLQYGNDIATMNGFMESRRLALRYTKSF
ncbi:MAG: transporter [Burkholderiaceae bacterium]|nr:transporter [Burkholderiaceae bacterium]NDE43855.1 transporter [Burkholderiaceae bacterium]